MITYMRTLSKKLGRVHYLSLTTIKKNSHAAKEVNAVGNINDILQKEMDHLTDDERNKVIAELVNRMTIEHNKNDRSGIYAKTQTQMAYNSNKIEGSTLTPDQTASLFNTGTLASSGEIIYRAKDIEEMTGHFSMFNEMLKTWGEPLSENLIKKYHYRLKAGVFEDMANGYPIGEYKNRFNIVSDIETASPDTVAAYMKELLVRYHSYDTVTVETLAKFHASFEKIHPFQDGNGRTGRMILFKECLKHHIIPIIVKDAEKAVYYHALHMAQTKGDFSLLTEYFVKEQNLYYEMIRKFLWVHENQSDMFQPDEFLSL